MAERLGEGERFQFDTPAQVFDELRKATAGGVADYSGMTYEKIAEQANRPVGTVKTQMRSALQKLRKVLVEGRGLV